MKWQALKAKVYLRIFKINDSFKSSLQKWIISHPYVIQYPIENDYITVKFDDGTRRVKT